MTDPSEALLRELEEAERQAPDPPEPVFDRTWAAIERRLGDGPPPLDPGGGIQATTLKIIGGTAVAALLTAGAVLWAGVDRGSAATVTGDDAVAVSDAIVAETAGLDRPADHETVGGTLAGDDASAPVVEPSAVEPSAVEPSSDEPSLADPKNEPAGLEPTSQPPVPGVNPRPRRRAEPTARPAPKTLADEMALMQRISSALKRADAAAVLGLVAAHQRDFPRGEFIEERSAAKARALCLRGELEAGRRQAKRFAKRWPGSIHRPAVDEDCNR